jgi:hypothetical protein
MSRYSYTFTFKRVSAWKVPSNIPACFGFVLEELYAVSTSHLEAGFEFLAEL